VPGIGIKLQNELSIRENVLLAQYAEMRGLDTVWASEYRRDAVVLMAMLAAGTEQVGVGTSIVPIYTRSPAVLAMSAAAVAEIAPGRAILGLGSSTPVIVEKWHGFERSRPLVALEEYIETIRSILRDERTQFAGSVVRTDGFRLEFPSLAAPDVRIFAAALAEKALATAARVADGVLLNAAPIGYLPTIRALVDRAAAAAGKEPLPIAGDVRVGIGSGEDLRQMRERQRKAMASYGGVGPYNRFYAQAGYPNQAAAIAAGWEAGDNTSAVAALDDEMLDAIVAVGSEANVRDRVAAFLAAGMDEVIVYPVWGAEDRPSDAIRHVIDVVADLRRTP
jgi:probable F420-dependent oxidoreductase